MDFRDRLPEFESWLGHFTRVMTLVKSINLQCLDFPIYKMGIIPV